MLSGNCYSLLYQVAVSGFYTISQIGSDRPSASILCVLCDSVVQFLAIVFRNSIT